MENLLFDPQKLVSVPLTEEGLSPLHQACIVGDTNGISNHILQTANIDTKTSQGHTPLHLACMHDQKDAVTLLLRQVADPKARDIDGWTALHVACSLGNTMLARLLLKHTKHVDTCGDLGFSPLHLACQNGHVEVVQLLMKHNYDINKTTSTGCTPLHIAAKYGHGTLVDMLLLRGADINRTATNCATPLHIASWEGHEKDRELETGDSFSPIQIACHNGNVGVTELLLQHNTNKDRATPNGFTPLHLACLNGHSEVVKILLKHGADKDSTTTSGFTPFHYACVHGHLKVLKILLKHSADFDKATDDGFTSFHIACQYGHKAITEILLKHNADRDKVTTEGFAPLHIACQYGHVAITEILLKHNADKDKITMEGFSPLHIACQYGHALIAEILLKNNVDKNRITRDGFTPLHIACAEGHQGIVEVLLNHEADIDRATPVQVTPLHLACQNGHAEVAEVLFEHNSDKDKPATDGFTPLHFACQNGHARVTEILLKRKADKDRRTISGLTPLHLACQNGHAEIAEILFRYNSDEDIATADGFTPLHFACQNGHIEVTQFLLRQKSDTERVTSKGSTPLQLAVENGHSEIISLIQNETTSRTKRASNDSLPPNEASELAIGGTSTISECSQGDPTLLNTFCPPLQRPYKESVFPESERIKGVQPTRAVQIHDTPPATAVFCDLKGSAESCQQSFFSETETTRTHSRPARLLLKLYGKNVETDTRDVELSLYIGDKDCRDWSGIPSDEKALKSKTLKRMPDSTKVLVKLHLDEDHKACWMHRKLNGEPAFPATQVIDVSECLPFRHDGQLEQVEWVLNNVQGTTPGFFRCFIDIGYTQDDDPTSAYFCLNPPKERLHVTLKTGTSADLTRSVSAPALHQGYDPSYSFELKTPTQDTHHEMSRENHTNGVQCEEELPITTGDGTNMTDRRTFNPDQIKVVPVAPDSEMRRRFQKMVDLCVYTEKEVYRMQQRPRGVFIIINNESFQRSKRELEHRVGTKNDVNALYILFAELGFQVEIKNECSSEEMESAISDVLRRDHSEYDCFGCAILSHGGEGVIICDNDSYLPIETLRKLVAENRNSSLFDKPKLLFIQACQGGSLDFGNEVGTACGGGPRYRLDTSFSDVGDGECPIVNDTDVHKPTGESSCTSGNAEKSADEACSVEELSGEDACRGCFQQPGNTTVGTQAKSEGTQKAKCVPYSVDGPKIPSGSDLFMGVSSCPGFAAYRSKLGSPYIQAIVKVFSEYACQDHLSDLMTKVSSQVSAMEANDERCKQQPTCGTTLRKKLYFYPGLFHSRTK